MDSGPDVSIVVATYNRCAGLKRLLRALAEQTYPMNRFEVIVVDDGSSDATPELLHTIAVPYALRSYAQTNSGPAVARNLGVAHARGSLILFLDDDILPVPGLVAAHVAAHGDATHTVVTGPLSPPPPAWRQPAWDRWDTMHLQEQYQAMTAGVFECTQRQFFTGNASLRRSLFDEAGGFDARFKRAEDMELAWRMSAQGARFIFEPRADGLHFSARPLRSWRHAAYLYGGYDVLMEREQGIPTFQIACSEFHDRHPLNRWLARLCVDRRLLRDMVVCGLSGVVHVADYFGADRIASLALSNVFNVQYWQGVSDEIGGAERLWRAVARHGEERLTDGRPVSTESGTWITRRMSRCPWTLWLSMAGCWMRRENADERRSTGRGHRQRPSRGHCRANPGEAAHPRDHAGAGAVPASHCSGVFREATLLWRLQGVRDPLDAV